MEIFVYNHFIGFFPCLPAIALPSWVGESETFLFCVQTEQNAEANSRRRSETQFDFSNLCLC